MLLRAGVSVVGFLMPKSSPGAKTFEAVLVRGGGTLNWTIIRVPLDVPKIWGKRGQLKVTGEINGFTFRTSLFPTGQGSHVMIVNKKMQTGGKTCLGMKARFIMQPDTAPREVQSAAEWTRILRESKRLAKYFESLNFSTRREIARWIAGAKHAETRQRRAEQMAERLMLVMEAERELPPVLAAALAHNPKARAGWEVMPPSHKRWHLFGIFGYNKPESRARRVAKAVGAMVEYAERKGKIDH
ncbi:MAG TPA: YdeI/OmpD-associated family protein [Candidatus Angelobacter sp.]|nr:YdeI/OmpD-associated family protein [Candidatus Angelobacter sp.]